MFLARQPPLGTPIPRELQDVAGAPVTLVWENAVGGLTGRVDGDDPRYIKWNRRNSGESLAAEAERLRWAEGRHPVPVVLDYRTVGDVELLVTRPARGISAVDPAWRDRSEAAVRAIAEGLRRLHALPTEQCPFEWSVESRIRAAADPGVPAHLLTPPPIDRLVVCHGDACAPNTLLDDSGFAANVDFGRLGLADRWADLAVATMSLDWNYEKFDETLFWDTYGVAPDPVRIAYYRALWNAT